MGISDLIQVMRVSVILSLLVLLAIITTVTDAKKKPKKPKKPSKSKPSKSKPGKSKGKPSKQQIKNIKIFKRLKNQSQALADDIKKLTKDIEAAEKLTEVSRAHFCNRCHDYCRRSLYRNSMWTFYSNQLYNKCECCLEGRWNCGYSSFLWWNLHSSC